MKWYLVRSRRRASNELLYSAGLLADRISINMELPTQDSLSQLAPNKNMKNIIRPMNQISETIAAHRLAIGKDARMERAGINRHLIHSIWGNTADISPSLSRTSEENRQILTEASGESKPKLSGIPGEKDRNYHNTSAEKHLNPSGIKQPEISDSSFQTLHTQLRQSSLTLPAEKNDALLRRPFAGAGQSTQMIIGATGETDLELIRTTQNLYQSFDLKRVFYSGYIPVNEDAQLPAIGTPVPFLREHRLYQADWLMRYYGFFAEELLTPKNPFFDQQLDPKCYWALQHLELFPVEINTAPAQTLLRVPGIGPTGVKKILSARRYGSISFDMLKKMHITLKRAQYFITCGGKMLYRIPFEEQFIHRQLTSLEQTVISQVNDQTVQYTQMNLFTDFHLQGVQA